MGLPKLSLDNKITEKNCAKGTCCCRTRLAICFLTNCYNLIQKYYMKYDSRLGTDIFPPRPANLPGMVVQKWISAKVLTREWAYLFTAEKADVFLVIKTK